MKSVISWLSTPYYFNPSIKFKLKVSCFHGLFIFLFLYIFKPFYLAQFQIILLEYTLGIGIIAFLGTFVVLYFPALIFKEYFNEDKWTIGRNLFLMVIAITFVGILLWYFGEMYKEPYKLKKLSISTACYNYQWVTLTVNSQNSTFFPLLNNKLTFVRFKKRIELS